MTGIPERCEADVLVVGSGPAGAVTAIALARQGVSVLLADGGPASAGDHDMLVSAHAQRGLASLGLPVDTLLKPLKVIRLSFGSGKGRPITDAGAAVCGAVQLRDELRRAAAAAGAQIIHGAVTSIARVADGYDTVIAGLDVSTHHVVIATGAAARDPLEPGLPSQATGIACARRFTGARLLGRMLLVMAAPSADDPHARPACAWALPGRDRTVTVAAARMGGPAAASPGDLLGTALEMLAVCDTRFAAITPAGPLVSGPLDAGFTPERATASGHLRVGDAAGLVNPFTGEGLTYAIQSGLQAARSIAGHPSDPDQACRAYASQLAAGFVGYFETARHAARRYHLTWRVLATAASSDHPFFAKARRAILLPEGLTGLTSADHVHLARPDTIMLAPFLAACDEVAITTIRTQWPFLARLMMAGDSLAHPRLRPAVLFFAGLLGDGKMPDIRHATVGAGIELAQLGALAFLGTPAAARPPRRGVDWAVATTILAGDFLLAQASRLIAESAPEVSWSFADWLCELATLRAGRLGQPCPESAASTVFASLFEFPARIGALLGGCSEPTVQALREAGYHCGHAFGHAEDILALRGERTRLDTTLRAMLQGRTSAIPARLGGRPVSSRRLARDPGLRSAALAAAADACFAAQHSALDAIASVSSPAAGRILRQFISTVVAPALAAGGMPREAGSDAAEILSAHVLT
jgi:flavin-dependent dehydrogenase